MSVPSWVLAGDVSLSTLIARTVQTHPAINSQDALVDAAQAGVESARWEFFPTPSVSYQRATTSTSDTTYGGDKAVTSLSLVQPLWTWGRLTAGMGKAEAQAIAASAARMEMQQQLAIRVVQAYGEWLSAYRKHRAYEQGASQHRRLLEQVKRRVDEGQAAHSDFVLASGRLASINAEMAAAQTQERISLLRLSTLSGAALDSPALAANIADNLSQTLPVGELLTLAEASYPSLARRRAVAQSLHASVDEARARLMPELQLRLERQYGNHFAASASAAQTRLFVGFTSQFGAGLSSRSAISQASAQYTAAIAEIEVEQRSLSDQVMADHALLTESAFRRQALAASVEMAGIVLNSWDRQYLAGRKSWQDLMNSARELVQTQAQLGELDAQQLVASWRLALITGQLQAVSPLQQGTRQ